MKYELLIESRAEKDLKKLDPDLFKLITTEIRNLAENPHPHNSKKITDSKNDWRIRIGKLHNSAWNQWRKDYALVLNSWQIVDSYDYDGKPF